MENEGIMSLPGGMQANQGQPPLRVSSADSYDAATTALGMVDPQSLAVVKESIRQNIAELELSTAELDLLVEMFEYMASRPDQYSTLVKQLEKQGVVDPGDMPDDYDPALIGTILSILNEIRMMRTEGAQAPMQMGPGAMPEPMAMAEGGLADVAQYLASKGRNGDTMLAHITPEEAQMLKSMGGSGTINPETGLPEFFFKRIASAVTGAFKGVVQAAKKVLSSPVGRVIGTIALAAILGPTAIGATLGSAGTAALSAGAVTLAGGGTLKDALVSGALGYVGGGGTIGGFSPLKAIGEALPGAGSALNVGLTTGAIGTGAGLLMGMKPQEALRTGAMAGLISGGLAGLQGAGVGRTEPQVPLDQQAPGVGTAADQLRTLGQTPAGAADIPEIAMGATPRVGPVGPVGAAGNAADIPEIAMGATPRAPAGTQAAAQPAGLFDRAIQGAKDIYGQYLSPDRPGLPADAGLLRRYAPLAAAGTAVAAATGAMKSTPANPSPLGQDQYMAESQRRARERDELMAGARFGTGLPTGYSGNPLVPTPSYSTIPVGEIPISMPGGITRSPGGVAQPYNVGGLYGVPLLYGQQPQGRAKGGEMTMQDFPRKTGPINGPGTGTSDSIPAMLSDGEFVFTAKAVRNAGGGSRRKGAARMYKLMKMLEGGPVKGK